MIKTTFMRRGQVVEMLMEEGFLENHVRTLLESGAIVALKLPGREDGRALYSRAQIERDVLKKMEV
jgi:hypothetical protein